jgi:hypothetical protein
MVIMICEGALTQGHRWPALPGGWATYLVAGLVRFSGLSAPKCRHSGALGAARNRTEAFRRKNRRVEEPDHVPARSSGRSPRRPAVVWSPMLSCVQTTATLGAAVQAAGLELVIEAAVSGRETAPAGKRSN